MIKWRSSLTLIINKQTSLKYIHAITLQSKMIDGKSSIHSKFVIIPPTTYRGVCCLAQFEFNTPAVRFCHSVVEHVHAGVDSTTTTKYLTQSAAEAYQTARHITVPPPSSPRSSVPYSFRDRRPGIGQQFVVGHRPKRSI